MAIKKLDDGRYELDTRTGGRTSKRVRKIFNRRADAVAYERYMNLLQSYAIKIILPFWNKKRPSAYLPSPQKGLLPIAPFTILPGII